MQILKWHFLWDPSNKKWYIFLKAIQMTSESQSKSVFLSDLYTAPSQWMYIIFEGKMNNL